MPSNDFKRGLSERAFTIKDIVGILHHDSDPSIGSGYDAPAGSILLVQYDANNGAIFSKQGLSDTAWVELGVTTGTSPQSNDTVAASSTIDLIDVPDSVKSIKITMVLEDDTAGKWESGEVSALNIDSSSAEYTLYGMMGSGVSYSLSATVSGGRFKISVTNNGAVNPAAVIIATVADPCRILTIAAARKAKNKILTPSLAK